MCGPGTGVQRVLDKPVLRVQFPSGPPKILLTNTNHGSIITQSRTICTLAQHRFEKALLIEGFFVTQKEDPI